MSDQIYIGDFAKGLKLDRLPFNIDNDSFPTMYNMYTKRGRAKRKRGTVALGRLQVRIVPTIFGNTDTDGNFASNILSQLGAPAGATIVPGTFNFSVGGNTYTETNPPSGFLLENGSPAPNGSFINYASGVVGIVNGTPVTPVVGSISYYPGLPVMGLEDFTPPPPPSSTVSSQYPVLLAFDTKYSYQCNQTAGSAQFYNVNFYRIGSLTYTGNPFTWSGEDYQQFWTTNYAGALWATNNKPGLHLLNATYVSGSGTSAMVFSFTLPNSATPYANFKLGDVLWFNEWSGGSTINGLVGIVSVIGAPGTYQVNFNTAQTAAGTGIVQALTNSVPDGFGNQQDGIRFYVGDPTATTGLPVVNDTLGWTNFAPPLTATSVSINNTIPGTYYLVGAKAILPFKDRLLFFSPYIQTATGVPILLADTVIWSWNGTPYYTLLNPNQPGLVPINQTANPKAFYVDQTGLGGYLSAGLSQPMMTFGNNQDALIIGFGGDGRKTRFIYTGNDIQPFLFFNINSELPSTSTFSSVNLDRGMLDIGQYGLAITDQQSSQRVDIEIPDEIFRIQNLNHGVERVNAIRDFFNEWIYFAYPLNTSAWRFPTQSLLFNYRDNTWGIQYENFTHHGNYRPQQKKSWASLKNNFTWNTWHEAWNSGATAPLVPKIIAGNPQGYVLIKGGGTGEAPSGTIQAFSADAYNNTQITSIDHCVKTDDYLYITNALIFTAMNGKVVRVTDIIDANNFVVDYVYDPNMANYAGLGNFTRLSQPLLQTKQFPFYWNEGRQVRLSVQKYLMDYTDNSQVTVNIYLSQDPDDAYNDPTLNVAPNNSLVYSQVLYTCPEGTNIGLTPANINLQIPTAEGSYQIWHRMSTSLIGSTFQVGITLSDAQMRNITYATDEITLHGMQFTVNRGPLLA